MRTCDAQRVGAVRDAGEVAGSPVCPDASASGPVFDVSFAALVAVGLGCYLGWQTVDISPTLFP